MPHTAEYYFSRGAAPLSQSGRNSRAALDTAMRKMTNKRRELFRQYQMRLPVPVGRRRVLVLVLDPLVPGMKVSFWSPLLGWRLQPPHRPQVALIPGGQWRSRLVLQLSLKTAYGHIALVHAHDVATLPVLGKVQIPMRLTGQNAAQG